MSESGSPIQLDCRSNLCLFFLTCGVLSLLSYHCDLALPNMSGSSLSRLGRIASPSFRSAAVSVTRVRSRPQPQRTFVSTASVASPTASSPAFAESSPISTSLSPDVVVERSSSVAGGFEFLEPWVPTVQSLADALHLSGPHAHALSVVALAFTVRTLVTLPVTLWQRKKTRKLADRVLPEWNKMKETIPLAVRARCRRANKSYEEFTVEVNKEVSAHLSKNLYPHF